MVFILTMAFIAGIIQLKSFYDQGNWLLVTIDSIVLIVSVLVILESISVISKAKRGEAPE